MSDIIIHGFPPSTFTRTARMAVVEKGLDHTLEGLDFRSQSHRAVHPFARMPAARINGGLVFETLAILQALEAVRPSPALFPVGDDGVRNATWISAACDYLSDTIVSDAIDREAARETLAPFDSAIAEQQWLSGSNPGAADLFAAPMVAFGLGVDDTLLGGHPHLRSWFERMGARSSFMETVA